MRSLIIPAILTLTASTALAETFTLDSHVSAAMIYPQGASVTRSIAFDLPAGQHSLVLPDVPDGFMEETLRILGGDGLVFGAISIRDTRLPPDDREITERAEIEALIEAKEDLIRQMEEETAVVGLRINAANARIKFLEAMGANQAQDTAGALDGGMVSIETMTAMVTMIGEQTLSALSEAQAARVEVASLSRETNEQREELKDLYVALEAVALPPYDRALVSIEVSAESDTSGQFQIEYLIYEAQWAPDYDFRLDQNAAVMTINRKAKVIQATGEIWDDARISLSTSQPSLESQLSPLDARRAHYYKPQPVVAYESAAGDARTFAAPQAVMLEEASMRGAGVDFQGVTAVYRLPEGTRLAGDQEPSLVTINRTELDVEMTAQVNMLYADGVFLVAEFTNDSPLPILPGSARFYRDGAFVGSEYRIPMVAAGAISVLGFGQIDGLKAERVTLRRETGESGVITTSNDRVEEYDLRIENRSGADWEVVVYDRIPFSEQEDLVISYSARPRPSIIDVDGKRGVLAWEFPLEDGDQRSIAFSFELEWPDGHELGFGN